MQPAIDLPRAVMEFLRAHVDHVVKLRFLLAMHTAPGGTSTVGVIARELDVPKGQVRDMANELGDEGLLRVSADKLELALRLDDRLTLSDLADWYARDHAAVLDALRGMGRGVSGPHG